MFDLRRRALRVVYPVPLLERDGGAGEIGEMSSDTFKLSLSSMIGDRVPTTNLIGPDAGTGLRHSDVGTGIIRSVETDSLTELVVPITTVAMTAVAGFAGAWVQAKSNRKATFEYGDLRVEAESPEDVEKILMTVRDLGMKFPGTES